MFTVYCARHGAEVLIWPAGIEAVDNTPAGIAVSYHCTCGLRGVWRTGRSVAEGSALVGS